MTKKINIECESCESQYTLMYIEGMVMEEKNLKCPFCGEDLETIEEIEENEEFPDVWGNDDE